MNKYEEEARALQKQGNICSYAIYKVFEKDYNLDGTYPLPRSEDGKCGALLTTIKILKETNHEDLIEDYQDKFLKEFGYLKCAELIKNNGRRCNDYVGFAANYLSKIL